jgi:hypothetical protein
MNLMCGDSVAVLSGDGVSGEARVGRAMPHGVALDLLTESAPDDRVLVYEGVALDKVAPLSEEEISYVSGHTR